MWLEKKQAFLKIHWTAGNFEAATSVLLDILKTNFGLVKTTDFQSIYFLHETLITVLVKMVEDVTPDFLATLVATEDGTVPEFTTPAETIQKLLGAFRV